jgi:hypothetical protein
MGNIGFGRELVSGWILVPNPPAMTTAFIYLPMDFYLISKNATQ